MIAAAAFLAVACPARAQGPCDLVIKQAAQVMGVAAGQPERIKPTPKIEICTVRSADRASDLSLTIDTSGQAPQSLATAKMIAKMTKDPNQAVKEEPGLGNDAFSLREKDKVFLMFGDGGRMLSLRLGRDRGITESDVDRARQLAKQLLAAK
jgi:hypothetical protein